jgi:hypothetical protein
LFVFVLFVCLFVCLWGFTRSLRNSTNKFGIITDCNTVNYWSCVLIDITLCCNYYMYYIYHGSYEWTYLNQRIRRMSWFK